MENPVGIIALSAPCSGSSHNSLPAGYPTTLCNIQRPKQKQVRLESSVAGQQIALCPGFAHRRLPKDHGPSVLKHPAACSRREVAGSRPLSAGQTEWAGSSQSS